MFQDLDLKSLLYEAYHKGKQGSQDLLFVVPFVAKVLESCSHSRVSVQNRMDVCFQDISQIIKTRKNVNASE